MRRLGYKLLLLLPIPCVMVGVSFYGDPAHLFSRGRYERKVASILLAGKNAAGVSNYDERLLQRFYSEGVRRSPQVLVLGSSRSMVISAKDFPGKSFFNGSVSGASLEDLLGIYQAFRSHGHVPSQLVLCLDPWLLNRNSGQSRWVSIGEEYAALARELGVGAGKANRPLLGAQMRYLDAVSPDYFRKSLKTLASGRSQAPVATSDSEGEADIKLSDGSLSYNRAFRSKARSVVDAEAIEYAAGNVYSLSNFDDLDPSRRELLTRFVHLLRKERVEVRFFLSPYHPLAYRRIVASGNYRMLPAAETFFRRLAASNRIPVCGSYDPSRAGLEQGDFFDGMHVSYAGVAKILAGGEGT